MSFTPAEVSGFIREAKSKLETAQLYVDAIGSGKSTINGLPQGDERFESPIDPKKVTELNSLIRSEFLEVSATLAKVASAIDDGIQPAVADAAVDPLSEVKG